MKIHKILVPYNFSNSSENALKYALLLAHRIKAQVCLFNVCLMPSPYIEEGYYDAEAVKFTEEVNLAHLNKLKEAIGVAELTETEVVSDISVVQGILTRMIPGDIDLVVMGIKGFKGLGELIWGTNAAQIIAKGYVPTIIVPMNYEYHKMEKVALAGDYRDLDNFEEATSLASLCQSLQTDLEIFNVNPTEHAISSDLSFNAVQLEDYFGNTSHSYHEIRNKNVKEGIIDYIVSHNIDLLAMIPRKRSFLQRLFKSSLTHKITELLEIPVLALHEN